MVIRDKSNKTLVKDIYSIFESGVDEIDEDVVNKFKENMAEILISRLKSYGKERKPTLRLSAVGKPDRQLYYDVKGYKGESFKPHTLLKFLYGDIIEEMLLTLVKIAGHDVKMEQEEVEINGVKGHIDAMINGEVVDVKSASSYAFKKFNENKLAEDDPFGYMKQISGYATALDTSAGFLAFDKQNGFVTYLPVSKKQVEREAISERVDYVKEMVSKDDVPERCYEDIPEGKSGNRKLAIGCQYCSHKERCWSDVNDGKGLRKFQYSYGPVYLTRVVREPKVMEIL